MDRIEWIKESESEITRFFYVFRQQADSNLTAGSRQHSRKLRCENE